ncbi:MAG: hypothetical protein FJX75_23125 [Armatimonadetes bacterium]|nr:hypothetical protein [Armatimonadota bacterium]
MDPHALSDDESLRAARSGDRAAFEVLHGRLAGPAYALARRLASGDLWREIEARRARRSIPVFAPSSVDAAAVLQAALTPALGG